MCYTQKQHIDLLHCSDNIRNVIISYITVYLYIKHHKQDNRHKKVYVIYNL